MFLKQRGSLRSSSLSCCTTSRRTVYACRSSLTMSFKGRSLFCWYSISLRSSSERFQRSEPMCAQNRNYLTLARCDMGNDVFHRPFPSSAWLLHLLLIDLGQQRLPGGSRLCKCLEQCCFVHDILLPVLVQPSNGLSLPTIPCATGRLSPSLQESAKSP